MNRLHRLLLELLPGGAKTFLSATQARALLATVRPRDVVGRTRRQLRRHVHDTFPIGDQPLSDVPADAVAALHRPQPVRPPAAGLEQLPVARTVSAEPRSGEHAFPLVEHLDRRRPLVWIHPDHHTIHDPLPRLESHLVDEESSATSSWADPS